MQNKMKRRKPVDFIDAEIDLTSDESDDLDEQLQMISLSNSWS